MNCAQMRARCGRGGGCVGEPKTPPGGGLLFRSGLLQDALGRARGGAK